jgi:hypothetical protein
LTAFKYAALNAHGYNNAEQPNKIKEKTATSNNEFFVTTQPSSKPKKVLFKIEWTE